MHETVNTSIEGRVGVCRDGYFVLVNDIVTNPLEGHYGKRVRVTVEVLDGE